MPVSLSLFLQLILSTPLHISPQTLHLPSLAMRRSDRVLALAQMISTNNTAKPQKDHLPQGTDSVAPRTSAPGRGSEQGTAGRPPSSLEELVWGWRTGVTPVRWWSGSQVKNIWSSDMEGGRTRTCILQTDTRLAARVPIPPLRTHTHTQTCCFISH